MAQAQETREARARDERRNEAERVDLPPDMDVRDEDLEPHEGLRYIARLFKLLSVLLILLLIGEIIIGLTQSGREAIGTLLVEATRTIVFGGLLWGIGDIALMLIESNHDLRATRLMVWQLSALMKLLMDHQGVRVEPVQPPMERGGDSGIRED